MALIPTYFYIIITHLLKEITHINILRLLIIRTHRLIDSSKLIHFLIIVNET